MSGDDGMWTRCQMDGKDKEGMEAAVDDIGRLIRATSNIETDLHAVGSDISNKAVSFDIRTVGKTTRKPHKMSYLTAVKKSME